MNEITLAAFVEVMLRQSAAGLFVAFVYALLKGWIVIGDQHQTEVEQMQEDHSGSFQSRKGDILWIENRRKNF